MSFIIILLDFFNIFSLNLLFPDAFKECMNKNSNYEKKIVESFSQIDFKGIKSLIKRSFFDLNCISINNFNQILTSLLGTTENFSQFSELFGILTFTESNLEIYLKFIKKV